MLPPFFRISGFRKNSTGTLLTGSDCLRLCAGFRISNLIRLRNTTLCGCSVATDKLFTILLAPVFLTFAHLFVCAAAILARDAGWYVFAVEKGTPRQLLGDEEDIVNKFRFGDE